MEQFNPKEWYKTNKLEARELSVFTPKDMYDLALLRLYQRRLQYATRQEMPHEAYL